MPVGYNRDPASPMGYSNVKIVPAGLSAVDADNRLREENQGTHLASHNKNLKSIDSEYRGFHGYETNAEVTRLLLIT